jgi:tetratricopeptide (TPR) repeat protein
MTSALAGLLLMASSIPSLVDQGDREFTRIRYPQAVDLYITALTGSTDSAEALWRLARVYVCQADISPDEQKLELYRQAEAFARRCIEADSMKSEGHTWRAAALGNIAVFEGGKTKVKLCYEIKRELECSIALNDSDDVAYSILGSFYMALGNVSWFERRLAAIFLGTLPDGGFEEAELALKKAIAIAPAVIRHHYELGLLYMQLDRDREAVEEFHLVESLRAQLASDRRSQAAATDFIAQLAQ